MRRIAFHFDRPAHATADQDSLGIAAERGGRGIEQLFARNDCFRLAHVGDDLLLGLTQQATRRTGQRQGGGHQFQKPAPPERLVPFGGLARKLAVQEFQEFRRLAELLEAAPILLVAGSRQAGADGVEIDGGTGRFGITHRWHTKQSVSCRTLTWYSFTNSSPSSRESGDTWSPNLKTWSRLRSCSPGSR